MKNQQHVPRDWTAEQALAIVDWLQGFVDTIWEAYGDDLIELMANRSCDLTDDHQLDLPF